MLSRVQHEDGDFGDFNRESRQETMNNAMQQVEREEKVQNVLRRRSNIFNHPDRQSILSA